MVKRVFVEKNPGFDVEAQGLLADLRDNLGISGLTGARIINRYDVQGLTEEQFERAAGAILSEAKMDSIYPEPFSQPEEYR